MRALVTGGGGFLGSALVRRLLARGDDVRMLNRSRYPALEALGVDARTGDVTDPAAVRPAVEGSDVVFHVAAKAGAWGREEDYWRANVLGTREVLRACLATGVPRLVHTSTPSVVHAGGDLAGVDESAPYASSYPAPYPRTKAVAERLVLAANFPELATVALRPHLLWGPGDTQLVPRILERARRGQLRFVGDGQARVDATYVDDAVEAHLLAADALRPGAACAGRAYFIASGEPLPVMNLVNRILAAAGLPAVTATVPQPVAYAAGAGLETAWRVLRRPDEPPLTRFLAQQLATDHWFDLTAARRDLGYRPQVSVADGLERLRQSLSGTSAGVRDVARSSDR